MLLKERGEV